MNKNDFTSEGSRLKRAALILAAFLSAYISLSLFISARSTELTYSGVINLNFKSEYVREIHKQQLSRQIDFMVWESERKSLATKLSDLLIADINSSPFNIQAWEDLTFVNKFTASPVDERVWVLRRAVALRKWNIIERTALTHHCVNEYDVWQRAAESFCDELIRRLPSDTHLPVLAAQLGISSEKLEKALETEGLPR